MSFNFGNTSAIGTSTPAKREYYTGISLQIDDVVGYVLNLNDSFSFILFSAAFGNFSFNTPATSAAPPAFGATGAAAQPTAQATTGFGAPSAFGQTSFGSTSKFLFDLIFLLQI